MHIFDLFYANFVDLVLWWCVNWFQVAGAVALLLSVISIFIIDLQIILEPLNHQNVVILQENPRASYATVRKELLEKAQREGLRDFVGAPDCSTAQDWPNHKFGYGRLNLMNVTAGNGAGSAGCLGSGLVLALFLGVINIVMVRQ